MSTCNCHCHRELPECEDSEFIKLLDEKRFWIGIKEHLEAARNSMNMEGPLFEMLIAMEQLWIDHKRELNRKLAVKGIKQIKR